MKAEFCDLQRSFGEIRLFPENVDDLWHLEHLVSPGDLVFATTLRTVETPSDKLRPEKLEKRPVRLGIRVGKLEFHPYVVRLRISGVIEHGADAGAYHTLNIEPGFEISVIRYWRPIDLERIDRAVKASVFDVVHILTIEEGEAELFRIRQYGPEGVVTITMGSGKGGDIDSRAAFFDRVSDHLDGITGPFVIAGPGFIKDDFLKILRGRNSPLAARAIVMETRRIGAGAVQEVIGHAVLDRIAGDIQLGREVQLMDEFLARMAKGLPVAYGRAEVQMATDSGAVEQLLISDTLIRDPIMVHLMDRAELTRAQVTVFSSSFDPGKQLEALGGVAALLRFPVR
jgi:protein pelota